jgi:hypothetical protein
MNNPENDKKRSTEKKECVRGNKEEKKIQH